MIKFFQRFQKTTYSLLIVFSFLIFMPQNAMATCPVSDVTSTSTNLVKGTTKLSTKVLKIQTSITLNLQNLKTAVVQAINGVSQAVTSAATTEMTTDQKRADAVLTKELQQEKRLEASRVARDLQPSGADCIVATGKQYVAESEVLSKATGQALASEFSNIYTGVGGGLSVSNSDNTIGYQADLFRYVMANFCNPQTNGGLMPTQANPIETANGPVWCGMDRGGDDELIDLHLKMPGLLLEPSKIVDNPKARAGVMISMMMMLGMPMDKTSLPSLDTAAGQRAYVQKMAQGTRMMLPATYISEKFGERFPSTSNGGSQWARDILKSNLGDYSGTNAEEVARLIDSKYDGNISQSQFLEAMVEQYTGAQYVLNTQGLSAGQYRRQIVNLTGMLNYLKSKRLKEAEVTNALSAAMYAADIGG